jgi:hypothetical protein
MSPAGRPKLPPGRKAVNVTVKLYADDVERLARLAEVHGGKSEAVRRGLEALEYADELGERKGRK